MVWSASKGGKAVMPAARHYRETDPAGNRKPTKSKGLDRIDGIMKTITACGLAEWDEGPHTYKGIGPGFNYRLFQMKPKIFACAAKLPSLRMEEQPELELVQREQPVEERFLDQLRPTKSRPALSKV